MTAINPNNLNEWINIKNPHGIEPLHLMISRIKLALIACSSTPIVWIILDVVNEKNEKHTKIILDKKHLDNMDKDGIEKYLKEEIILKTN